MVAVMRAPLAQPRRQAKAGAQRRVAPRGWPRYRGRRKAGTKDDARPDPVRLADGRGGRSSPLLLFVIFQTGFARARSAARSRRGALAEARSVIVVVGRGAGADIGAT